MAFLFKYCILYLSQMPYLCNLYISSSSCVCIFTKLIYILWQSPQKYSSKRPAEINLNRAGQEKNDSLAPGVEEHHVRVLKRQKKLSYVSLETSGKNDVRYQAVSSKFVESTVPGPTPESKCGGTHSSSCALQPSIPNSSHEAKTVCAFCQSSNLSQVLSQYIYL